jgi:hypothetical protein
VNQLKEVLEELEELVEQHERGGGLSFRYTDLSLELLVTGFY